MVSSTSPAVVQVEMAVARVEQADVNEGVGGRFDAELVAEVEDGVFGA